MWKVHTVLVEMVRLDFGAFGIIWEGKASFRSWRSDWRMICIGYLSCCISVIPSWHWYLVFYIQRYLFRIF